MLVDEPLLDRTYRLLDASPLTYGAIASGASVDINWLSKLKQRAIAEPGVTKVQRVHDFLAGVARPRRRVSRQRLTGAYGKNVHA